VAFFKSAIINKFSIGATTGALALAGLIHCGGGGGTKTPPPPLASAKIAGPWVLKDDTGAHYLLIVPGADADSFAVRSLSTASGAQVSATFSNAGGTLDGAGTLFLPDPASDSPSFKTLPILLSGTASDSPARLQLSLKGDDLDAADAFSVDAAATLPVEPSDLLATFDSPADSNVFGEVLRFQLTAGPDNTLIASGSDADVTITATLTQLQPHRNAFNVSATVTPKDVGKAPASFSGLAYLRAGAPTSLVVMAVSSDSKASFTAIFNKL
jgi:hypothetical protein